MRGEYEYPVVSRFLVPGSPPLARGIPFLMVGIQMQPRITPACAGNTQDSAIESAQRRDHPRLRGEYSNILVSVPVVVGSPPLARGIRP